MGRMDRRARGAPTAIGCMRWLGFAAWAFSTTTLRAQQPTMAGYTAANAATEQATEARVIARPSGAEASAHSRVLSREPHMAGTPAQMRTRDYVLAQMRQWGLETSVRAYDVYMPHPTAVHVWRVDAGPTRDSTELTLTEGPVPGDTTSSAYPQIPTFNAYAGVGTGAGEIVYANYGLIEDYAHLDSVGISVAGKVVVARYGRSFRGIKAREAEKHHAAALLIYSDPAEDGYARGDVFPDGPMRPEQGVQRGSIFNGDGDPSTPGYPSVAGAPRLAAEQMAVPHIPVVPISYHNAALLLRGLHGTGVTPRGSASSLAQSAAPLPESWQGALPFRYHIGPGPTRARVTYAAESGPAAYHTIWDTFGIVRGSTYPDEVVMIGAHRDAWGPGAADNVSGVVSVLEAAHAVADEIRAGHRPKRTIVFATWDAEEWALIGSTEYVEEDSLRLTRNGVAYFNQDVTADGPLFAATGSPSLRSTLRAITSLVSDPRTDTAASIYAMWRRATNVADSAEPSVGDPGGGSDFAGFANHLGIPIIEWGFTGPTGVYHSAYDDYTWQSRFGDPGFVHHAASARLGAALLLRFANADVLPYDYVEYAKTMRRYVAPLDSAMRAKGWSVSTTALTTAIDNMGREATHFAVARDQALNPDAAPMRAGQRPAPTPDAPRTGAGQGSAPTQANLEEVNRALRRVERALTRPAGLRTRPWVRSLTYASDENNGYADMAFPSIGEAVRAGDVALAEQEVADLASRFDAATAALRDADLDLAGLTHR